MKHTTLKHNFVVYLIRTLFNALTPLLIFPYASHLLGVSNIGQVAYAQSIATYFEYFAMLGMNSYGVREGAKCRDNPQNFGKLMTELFQVNAGSTVASGAVYMILVCSVTQLQPYRVLLVLFSLEVICKGLNFDWFYNIIEDYDYIAKRTIVFQLLDVIVLLAFVRDESDAIAYAVVLLLPCVLTSVTNIKNMVTRVHLFGYGNYHYARHVMGTLAVFSVVVSAMIYTLLDTTMLGVMRGDYDVGLYTAASKLTRQCVQLITSMCSVFLPRLSVYRAQRNIKDFQKTAMLACNVIVGLSIPAMVGILMLANPLIILFSGSSFLEAVPAMRILTLNFIFSAIDGFLAWQILVPYNEERFLLLATSVGAVLDFVLNLFLIPVYGTRGAAVATLLAECVIFVFLLLRSRKYLPIRYIAKSSWYYLVASLPIFPICWLVEREISSAIGAVAVSVVISILVYGVILCLLGNPYAKQYLSAGVGVLRKHFVERKSEK